ncbi:hypothetical protein CP97_02865 [Aurantiacibacter atlanticus]|uniref:Uncharacterized protein n=1 Tax=Aurantiacibacter atlanticus TaxID=1648404 RepID=A0A0H4V9R3_9SPHN|nr:hypothetical protein CP97_02865 [Aurantiacibacter atlanticus]
MAGDNPADQTEPGMRSDCRIKMAGTIHSLTDKEKVPCG